MTETPVQYEIKSLSDFLNIPAEKLPECLGDFEQWVALRRSMADGFKLLEPLFGDLSVAVEMKDAFIWLDDGLSGFSQINIVCGEEQIGTLSLTQEGAALLLPQRELTAERLAGLVGELNQHREQLNGMAQAARRVAILNATERVAAVCRELINDERRA